MLSIEFSSGSDRNDGGVMAPNPQVSHCIYRIQLQDLQIFVVEHQLQEAR